ncbi:MAG: Mut7-C RNAse domain-containing protein [Dehalococcoidales bacterium]|nr:Mut7-C RNAse domain-containing protein [Dehalococcoidales bacterium]
MNGSSTTGEIRFIVDHNVGKLAKWLRMMGYDSLFFDGEDDTQMVRQALAEGRMILTRDAGIMKRRVVHNGRLKALLIESEEPERQMRQVMDRLHLNINLRPFTLCLECNHPLVERSREEVKDRVPPHVFKTQAQYMECPACRRIYWRGTHWEAMTRKLEKLANDN